MLDAVRECRRLGYDPVKINVVAVKDHVEADIVPLARYGRDNQQGVDDGSYCPESCREGLEVDAFGSANTAR